MRPSIYVPAFAAAVFMAAAATGQVPPKRPLKHSDYDIWNTAANVTLSPDGKWLAYNVTPPEGDGRVVIKSLAGTAEYVINRGGRPPVPEAGATPVPLPVPGRGGLAGSPVFTPDGKRVLFPLPPTKAELDKARADKVKPEDVPQTVLAVVDLATGAIAERIPKVKAFAVHGDAPGWLLIHKEAKPEDVPIPTATGSVTGGPGAIPPAGTPPPAATPSPGGGRQPRPGGGGGRPGGAAGAPGAAPAAAPARPVGSELVVRNLGDGKETSLVDVADFSVSKDAKTLVYTVVSKKDDATGIYATPVGVNTPAVIKAGKGKYSRPTWDEKQTRLAFFFDDAPTPAPGVPAAPAKPRVYVWERAGTGPAAELLGPGTAGLKAGWQIVDRGGLSFTPDGLKLAVSTAPETRPTPAGPVAPTAAADKIDLDIWHWKDEQIQPMQKIRGDADRTRSYSAVYFFDTKQFRHLSDEAVTVPVPDFGDWATRSNDKPYRYLTGYGATLADVSLVNVRTGDAKELLKAHTGQIVPSAKGKFLAVFDGKDWHAAPVPGGKLVNLTAKLPVKFFDEDHDTPSEAPPYGFAGWTADENFVLVQDKYDIWKLAADGSSAVNLTKAGRPADVEFRVVRIPDGSDEPFRGYDLSKPLLLAAENQKTRDTGFYRLEPGASPKLLVMGARKYGTPTKAKKADTMLLTVSTFYDAPDYYAADANFREIRRVTDINPRKAEFIWGKAELVEYKSADGLPLSGMLIKPENFDPAKKYPMMVYIYERLTQTLHDFKLPNVGTSINPTYYASNGYLVFMPDIAYTIGSPGQSAMKCVLPAVQAVADKGFVDDANIGIQGHSWGGYQIAYMVTQTNRFKAAEAGAPVANMTSAYGGVRWGTGLPRQFQYERTQSRIGATLWQAPMKYIENSPVFMADRVKTPLLMLHNDQDDAVPWYQGIEYYLALRRLNKEVYLLNYNGEFHGLRQKKNQRDYTVRMQQFFDHHLKGAPAPEWMAKGVPFADREKEKEQYKGLFTPAGK